MDENKQGQKDNSWRDMVPERNAYGKFASPGAFSPDRYGGMEPNLSELGAMGSNFDSMVNIREYFGNTKLNGAKNEHVLSGLRAKRKRGDRWNSDAMAANLHGDATSPLSPNSMAPDKDLDEMCQAHFSGGRGREAMFGDGAMGLNSASFAKNFGGKFMSGVGVPVSGDAEYFAGDMALGGGRGPPRGGAYGFGAGDELFMSLGAQLGAGFSPPEQRARSEQPKGASEDGFDAYRYPAPGRSPRFGGDPAASPVSPISPLSPMAHNAFRERYPENASRTSVVRRYADDLYKIRPRFQAAIAGLMKNGMEEAETIMKTVQLYSLILCNWKQQTLFVYNRMRDSLMSLQHKLETEMMQNRMMYKQFCASHSEMRERNKTLELNLKSLQSGLGQSSADSSEGKAALTRAENTEKSLRLELEKKDAAVSRLEEELAQCKREVAARCFEIEKAKAAAADAAQGGAEPERFDGDAASLAKSLAGTADVIKDALGLANSADKARVQQTFLRLKGLCGNLSAALGDQRAAELFAGGHKAKVPNSSDSIDVIKVLDRRVSEDGKTQVYVSVKADGAEKADGWAGECDDHPNAFTEHVWVDLHNLAGGESLMNGFENSKSDAQ